MTAINQVVFVIILSGLCLAGCNNSDNDNPPPPGNNSNNNNGGNNNNDTQKLEGKQYFEATIAGETHKLIEGKDKYFGYLYNSNNSHDHQKHDSIPGAFGASLESEQKTKSGGILFGDLHWLSENSSFRAPSKERFHAFFKEKGYHYQYHYDRDSNSYKTKRRGITIRWLDESGKFWRSIRDFTGPNAQNGSNFKITKIVEKGEREATGKPFVTCEMKFNCTLYDSAGNSVKLTNGEARLSYVTSY